MAQTTLKITPKQQEYLEAYKEIGSYRGVARALGVRDTSVRKSIKNIIEGKQVAFDEGSAVPIGHVSKRATVAGAITPDGEFIADRMWSKTEREDRDLEEILKAYQAPPAIPEILPLDRDYHEDLMNVFTLTDAHIGMMAWAPDGGADWNLEVAERVIMECMSNLSQRAAHAGTATLAVLGDYFHYDSMKPVTPKSGHILSSDGTPAEMLMTGIRVLRQVIDLLLRTHKRVRVVIMQGNHDPMLSQANCLWLKELYSLNPRVDVDQIVRLYHAIEWGDCMLGWHHGHEAGIKDVDKKILSFDEYREMYGRTKQLYIHMGDKHHSAGAESSLACVIQHPTLIARDVYATGKGYRSERKAKVYTYHKKRLERGYISESVY